MKSWFANLRLGTKLTVGFGVGLVLTFGVVFVGALNINSLRHNMRRLSENSLAGSVELGRFSYASGQARTVEYRVATSDRAKVQSLVDREAASMADADKALDSYSKCIVEDEDRQLTNDLKEAWGQYKDAWNKQLPLVTGPDSAAALKFVDKDLGDMFRDVVRPKCTALTKWNEENAKALTVKSDRAATKALEALFIMGAAAMLIGALFAAFITRLITRPVKQVATRLTSLRDHCVQDLTVGLQAFAAGNLTISIEAMTKPVDVYAKDEVGQMAHTFNEMLAMVQGSIESYNSARRSLTQLVGQLASSSRQVSATSYSLALSSEQSGQASTDIASGSEKLAQGATDASATMERLVEQVADVQRSSEAQQEQVAKAESVLTEAEEGITGVAAAAQTMSAAAHEGHVAVSEIVTVMEAVKGSAEHATVMVRELDAKGRQIGTIVQSIESIAEQTNLLALNAAIEAARAGEHGRGFAVVADEVRKLAEKAASATKEITQLITDVTVTVEHTVQAIEGTTAGVTAGAAKTDQAGKALENILSSAGEVATRSEQVAALTGQATSSVGEVSRAATENTRATEAMAVGAAQVSDAMTDVAAVSEESAAGAQQLSATVQEVGAAAIELSQMSEELKRLVGRFQIEEVLEESRPLARAA
jgi:methyl-accepting chemotaxis protein